MSVSFKHVLSQGPVLRALGSAAIASARKKSGTPVANLILDVLAFVEQRGFGSYCGLIDSTAIAHLMDATKVTTERIRVIVERESRLSLGQTIVERRENFAWDGLAEIDAASDADFNWIGERLIEAAGG